MTTPNTAPAGVDLEWLGDFTTDWLTAWNSHDEDRLLALMAPDIVYDDSAWPTPMHGHDDVRAFLRAAWRALPDMTFEIVEGPYILPGEPKAAFHWRAHATFTGPMDPPGYAPTGRRAEFDGVDYHEYRDGKVARLRIDFDVMDLARQLALLPAQGSRIERAMARLQRLGARFMR
jgi:steroid delta-isomerase-like uncharacterized protein